MERKEEARSVRLAVATPEDAGPLAVIAALAFPDDRSWQPSELRDANLALDDPSKGPPHTSYAWTRSVLEALGDSGRERPSATYYKAVLGESLVVGGLFVVPRPDLGTGEWRCEGIYVDPDHQGRGVGRQIIRLMYRHYPDVARWTLETPEYSTRNHAFYEGMGFTKIGVSKNPDVPFRFFDYENALPQKERLRL